MNKELLLKSPSYKKAMDALQKMVREHPKRYRLGVLMSALVTLAYTVARAFQGNIKRLASLSCAGMVFVACSSFAFTERSVDVSFPGQTTDILRAGTTRPQMTTSETVELTGAEGLLDEDAWFTLQDIMEMDAPEADLQDAPVSDASTGFRADDWRLILVNKQHPIPADYEFPLGDISSEMHCDRRILPYLQQMFTDAYAEGLHLYVASPYRSGELQLSNFNNRVRHHLNNGHSYAEAYTLTSQVITIPGASEHEIGLALDIVCAEYRMLEEGFGATSAGRWLAEHCAEYGFIVRYPKGKEHITAIEYEPWHFRYVGREAATIIMEEGITLEEFWAHYIYRQ